MKCLQLKTFLKSEAYSVDGLLTGSVSLGPQLGVTEGEKRS